MLKRKEFILGAAAGLLVAAGATAGGVISWPGAHAETRPGQIVASAGASGLAFAPPQGAPLSFADIVQQVAPAVVQIEVETPVERPQGLGGFQIPGLPGLVIPGPQQRQGGADAEPQLAAGAGSGFFISADGYIVTNNHVVANARTIKVKLTDGRTLDAKLVGRDENTDLAVIKVEGSSFSFVSFEEGAEPRVGDWVVAVGNPFGLGGTATAGIVSAKGRNILEDEATRNYVDYLQIDAAINRGNSGGPTFDIYGRVIGVNSAIISPGGGSVGIGFAVPASVAKPITDRLIRDGAIERGYIGVLIGNLTDELRAGLDLPASTKGAYVSEVTEGGPAEQGGLQAGDVVLKMNGQDIDTSTALTRRVADVAVGQSVRLDILRDGRPRTVTLRVAKRPGQAELDATRSGASGAEGPAAGQAAGEAIAGLNVAPMSQALRSRYSIPANVSGLVVTGVAAGVEERFPAGMVILRAGNAAVSSPAEFQAAVEAAARAGRDSVLLLVWTPSGNRTVFWKLPKAE